MRTLVILMLSVVSAFAQANKPLQSVDTIADLVARRAVNNERIVVLGWRTVGDWGAPRILRHDPDSVLATNLGCVFGNAGPGRYLAEDCESGEVDVRWFGTTGDGVTDDSVAIQDALTYAKAKVVNLGVGTNVIGTPLTISRNMILRGRTRAMTEIEPSEMKTCLRAADGLDGPILTVAAGAQVAIDGVGFDGNRDNQTTFTGGSALLELLGGGTYYESTISDVIVTASKTNAIYVFRPEVLLERVKCVYNDGDGIRFGSGITGSDPWLYDFTLRSVQVGYNKGDGLSFYKTGALRFFNVDSYNNNGNGVRIDACEILQSFNLIINYPGKHGLALNDYARDMNFFGGLICEANYYQFENYRDPLVSESTNTSPSGTYANLYLDNTGTVSSNKLEIAFYGTRFYLNGAVPTRPAYLIQDARATPGAGLSLIQAKLSSRTNFFDLGTFSPGVETNAFILGAINEGVNTTATNNLVGRFQNDFTTAGRYQGSYFDATGTNAAVWVRNQNDPSKLWVVYSPVATNFLRLYYQDSGAAFDAYWFPTNGTMVSSAGTYYHTGNAAFVPLAGGTMTGALNANQVYVRSASTNGYWLYSRSASTNYWASYVPTDTMKLFHGIGSGGYDVFQFQTNGAIASVQGTFWNSGNLTAAAALAGGNASNFFRGDGVFTNIVPIAPTNNGAYVLFVTNGVASWITLP